MNILLFYFLSLEAKLDLVVLSLEFRLLDILSSFYFLIGYMFGSDIWRLWLII